MCYAVAANGSFNRGLANIDIRIERTDARDKFDNETLRRRNLNRRRVVTVAEHTGSKEARGLCLVGLLNPLRFRYVGRVVDGDRDRRLGGESLLHRGCTQQGDADDGRGGREPAAYVSGEGSRC